MSRLRGPATDAKRLAAALSDPAIGDFDVDVVLDGDESRVTRRIARFFADARRDDVLLLHMSCHGVKDAAGRLYLAAADTEMDLLDATAISAAWLDEQISQSRSGRTLLLLDCCFSGKFPFNATARAAASVDVQDTFNGRGRAVITASNAMEYAYEGDELSGEGQPSHFTSAVLDALESGEADRDQDRWISVDELYDYVYDRVKEVAPQQTPSKQIALEGPLYVARSRYVRPVTPAKLDDSLLQLAAHPTTGGRLGAIDELERLLQSDTPAIVLAARHQLEVLANDDSHRVRRRADDALAGRAPQNTPLADDATLRIDARSEYDSARQPGSASR